MLRENPGHRKALCGVRRQTFRQQCREVNRGELCLFSRFRLVVVHTANLYAGIRDVYQNPSVVLREITDVLDGEQCVGMVVLVFAFSPPRGGNRIVRRCP